MKECFANKIANGPVCYEKEHASLINENIFHYAMQIHPQEKPFVLLLVVLVILIAVVLFSNANSIQSGLIISGSVGSNTNPYPVLYACGCTDHQNNNCSIGFSGTGSLTCTGSCSDGTACGTIFIATAGYASLDPNDNVLVCGCPGGYAGDCYVDGGICKGSCFNHYYKGYDGEPPQEVSCGWR